MKKNLFFSLAAAMAAIGAAYATKKVVDKNSGMKPTFDKARNGATTMVDKTKGSPVASAITGALAALRDRLTGSNDDDIFVGEIAGEKQRGTG